VLNLPLDYPRPALQTYRGGSLSFNISVEQTQRIKALAHSEGVTLYMFLLAAYQVLLSLYTGQEDILIGTPTAGRNESEFQGTVGYFVNPVTLRGNLSNAPDFKTHLAQTRDTVLNALSHQDFPFIRVVENQHLHQDPSRSPIFQCLFNLHSVQRAPEISKILTQNGPGKSVNFGGMQLEPYFIPQEEGQFELSLEVIDTGETLLCTLRYHKDLFRLETAEQLQKSFQILLASILENPSVSVTALSVISAGERQRILEDWNQTTIEYPLHLHTHQLFEAQVERTPDSIAAIYEDQSLTYTQLNDQANQLAHFLKSIGVGSDQMVGVYLERSLDMLIALLGVMKAGGAYVPMDPIYPPQRIQFMMEDSQMQVLITQRSLLDSLPSNTAQCVLIDENRNTLDNQIKDNPDPIGSSDSLAYVIFTSGSTGRPKGVQIPHRALVNFLLSMQQQPGIQPVDALASVTTLSFDIAGLELFLPLISGARVIILSADTSTDGVALAQALDHYGATILQATPATWRLLVETGWPGRPGLKMLCGGEPLPLPLAQQLLQKGGELWNMYGPTETTIWSTLRQITHDDTVISIGHPIANTQAYILDRHLQPVPPGVIGSLYIGGDGLARGYLNRPDLTAEKFINHPFKSGERIYHTGDLARYLADGSIECLGRDDSQVKIRGFRIELGEIEAVLRTHPAIKHAVILAREDFPGDKRLVAYYTAEGSPTSRELSRFLREKLPSYMIPSAYVALDAFPQTPNGKVNRQALPAPVQSNVEIQTHSNPPTTANELLIAEIWKELLHVDRISVFDNFFDLGGHSLLAMRVVAQIQEKSGVRIEPAYLRIESLGQLALRLNDSSS
jgi:amino acid adenylation domain-containing protein